MLKSKIQYCDNNLKITFKRKHYILFIIILVKSVIMLIQLGTQEIMYFFKYFVENLFEI